MKEYEDFKPLAMLGIEGIPVYKGFTVYRNFYDYLSIVCTYLYCSCFQLLQKSDWNGEPRGYRIYYRMKESIESNWSVLVLDNGVNMNSAILIKLEEWMPYEVKMAAYNDVGIGVNSSVTVERTHEAGRLLLNMLICFFLYHPRSTFKITLGLLFISP